MKLKKKKLSAHTPEWWVPSITKNLKKKEEGSDIEDKKKFSESDACFFSNKYISVMKLWKNRGLVWCGMEQCTASSWLTYGLSVWRMFCLLSCFRLSNKDERPCGPISVRHFSSWLELRFLAPFYFPHVTLRLVSSSLNIYPFFFVFPNLRKILEKNIKIF